jgi:hypothetical protein
MRRPDLKDRRRLARDLAEMWSRISGHYLSADLGCSCCAGGVVLQASDFELDIIEFLIRDARKAGLTSFESFLGAVARRGVDRYSLPKLIDAIAEGDHSTAGSDKELEFALVRLRPILSSIEATQNRGQFACD